MEKKDLTAVRVIRAGKAEALFFETSAGPVIHEGGDVILLDNGMIHMSNDDGTDVTTHINRCDVLWNMGRPPKPPKTDDENATTVVPVRFKK